MGPVQLFSDIFLYLVGAPRWHFLDEFSVRDSLNFQLAQQIARILNRKQQKEHTQQPADRADRADRHPAKHGKTMYCTLQRMQPKMIWTMNMS